MRVFARRKRCRLTLFQRGQIGEGAAAAIMMLAALAVVLVPYSLWVVWRRRRESRHG